MATKHFLDLAQGFHEPEIVDALKQPKGERYIFEQFHKGSRASKRFFETFQIAYDSLLGSPKGASDEKS